MLCNGKKVGVGSGQGGFTLAAQYWRTDDRRYIAVEDPLHTAAQFWALAWVEGIHRFVIAMRDTS